LVDNDTTSGLINSRVIIYKHVTFQKRNKNPLKILPHGDRQGLLFYKNSYMTNQLLDLKKYDLQVLSDSELKNLNGGGFWHGLLVTVLGAAEIAGGITTYLFDKGALLNEGVKDAIAGIDEIQK
jgi:hypothetical protein